MPLLTIQSLEKSYGSRPILSGASLGVEEGEKVGFIGPNGTGKSTLFAILAGLEPPDAGTIAIRRGATIGFLAQEPEFASGTTIRAAVSGGRREMIETLAEYETIAGALASGPAVGADRLLARQGELMARIDDLGGWDWQHEIDTLLSQLGIGDPDRRMEGLSGGERKRVALARVLLDAPDLLLLDEPTNHLDADTTLWLEDRLLEYRGAVLLVTHDRYFLDRVVTRMVEIDRAIFNVFDGGYTEYLEARAAREERLATEAAKRDQLIEKELEWVKRSPAARTGKQKARIKRLDSSLDRAESSRSGQPEAVDFQFAPPPRLGRTVLDLDGITHSFGDRTLIRDLSTRFRAGERIGVIGSNGAGKTTLLRIIMGELEPDSGEVKHGQNTRVAYFDQARTDLDPTLSVYESVAGQEWVEFGGRRIHARSYLERFLFPTAMHELRVGGLSGGERNRLLLAKLMLREANLLILDEPTNDLDLQTLRVLESALVDFGGSVLVVTHDRFFLDRVATGLLVFAEDGVVHRHEGGYDLYRRLRDEAREVAGRSRGTGRSAAKATAKTQQGAARGRRLGYAERRELEGIESAILEAEALRDELGEVLTNPSLYVDTPDRVASARAEFEAAERKVEALYGRWAELEELAAAGG